MLRTVSTGARKSNLSTSELETRCAGAAIALLAAFLPWLSNRACRTTTVGLADLPITRWLFLGLLVVLAVATGLEQAARLPRVSRGAATVAGLLAVLVPTLGLLLIEIVAMWAYPSVLPASARRVLPGARPLIGLWLAIIGGAIVLIGVSGGAPWFIDRLHSFVRGLIRLRAPAVALVLLIVAIPFLVIGRASAWVLATSPAGTFTVPGYAVPWFGVATLVLLLLVLVASCAVFVRPHVSLAIILITAGWGLTLLAAIVLIPEIALPGVTAPAWIQHDIEFWITRLNSLTGGGCTVGSLAAPANVALSVAVGPIMVYAAGLAVAVAGILTIQSDTMEEP